MCWKQKLIDSKNLQVFWFYYWNQYSPERCTSVQDRFLSGTEAALQNRSDMAHYSLHYSHLYDCRMTDRMETGSLWWKDMEKINYSTEMPHKGTAEWKAFWSKRWIRTVSYMLYASSRSSDSGPLVSVLRTGMSFAKSNSDSSLIPIGLFRSGPVSLTAHHGLNISGFIVTKVKL